jgi:hypothetical protein
MGQINPTSNSILTPKVLRGQILVFVVLGLVVVIRRCDMIFGQFYGS